MQIQKLSLYVLIVMTLSVHGSVGHADEGLLTDFRLTDLLATSTDHPQTEREKIEFLLTSIEQTSHQLIRNGKNYTGQEAANHLRWKWRFAMWRIKTARQFIDHIASQSKLTKQPYQLQIDTENIYPLSIVLDHELERLEQSFE